jgi:hypothetical protein
VIDRVGDLRADLKEPALVPDMPNVPAALLSDRADLRLLQSVIVHLRVILDRLDCFGAAFAVTHPQDGEDRRAATPIAPEPPPGIVPLSEALARLVDVLPGLKAALDRQADPRPEPLVYRKADAARLCGMSVRLWERLLAAGKAPKPVAYAGKCPLWTKEALERWLKAGGGRI